MGKNQSASNLTNIIKQDASGNITFVSGSTTLMSVSSSGAVTTTGNVAGTASYASNADLLDGTHLSVLATTGSNTFKDIQYISSSINVANFTSTASLYTDGGLRVGKDAYVSGTLYLNNVTVYGTQSIQYITSSQLNITTNLITVNTATPSVRFGGIAVQDSGSVGGLTGSLLWDSQTNNWIYSNPSGSGNYDSAMVMMGPQNSSGLGNEVGITVNAIPKGAGGHHMTSSGIFESGSVVGIGLTPYNNTIGPSLDMKNGVGMFGYGDAAYISGNLYFDGAWKVKNAGTGSQITLGGEITFNTTTTGSAGSTVTNNERMRITNAGLVGIGTSSPNGYMGLTINQSTSYAGLAIYSTAGNTSNRNWALQINDQVYGDFSIKQSSAQNGDPVIAYNTRLYIDPSGNVGIATYSPRSLFDIRFNADRGLRFSSPGVSSEATITSYQGNVTGNIRRLRLVGDSIYFNTGDGSDSSGTERVGINSSGHMIMSYQPSFYATSTAGSSTYSGSEVIVFNTTRHNIGSCYNTSTGRFTAPVAGRYLFTFNCYNYAGYTNSIVLTINGSQYVVQDVQPLSYAGNVGSVSTGFTIVWELAVNDYVEVRVRSGGSANIYRAHSHFSGHLLG